MQTFALEIYFCLVEHRTIFPIAELMWQIRLSVCLCMCNHVHIVDFVELKFISVCTTSFPLSCCLSNREFFCDLIFTITIWFEIIFNIVTVIVNRILIHFHNPYSHYLIVIQLFNFFVYFYCLKLGFNIFFWYIKLVFGIVIYFFMN